MYDFLQVFLRYWDDDVISRDVPCKRGHVLEQATVYVLHISLWKTLTAYV